MSKLRITQIKSGIDRPKNQKLVLQSLGLKRIRHTVEHEHVPSIVGMIKKVEHLVTVEVI